jgi:hypothetical protein
MDSLLEYTPSGLLIDHGALMEKVAANNKQTAISESNVRIAELDKIDEALKKEVDALIKSGAVGEDIANKNKELADKAKANAEKRAEAVKAAAEKKAAKDEEARVKEAEAIKKHNENLTTFYDAVETERQSKITDAQEKEKQELANKYEKLYELADKAGKSTKDLQEQQAKDSQAITKKYNELDKVAKDEKDKLEKERVAKDKAFLEELTLSKLQKLTSQYEAEKLLYVGNKEILKALDVKYAKDKEVLENEELTKKRERTKKGIDMGMAALSILNDAFQMSAGKSEKDQRKAFKAQKAFNLASALTNTFLAVTGALTAGGNPIKLATGTQFVEAGIAAAAGAVQIAKIAGTQFDSGGSSAGGGSGGSTAPTMSAPQFNVVGQSGVNQLASLNQQPIQAYVVSGQVTSQQALDRNRLENATLGG